ERRGGRFAALDLPILAVLWFGYAAGVAGIYIGAVILEKLLHAHALIGQQGVRFRELAADHIVVVSRQCDRSENRDDQDRDHHFDKRKSARDMHRGSFGERILESRRCQVQRRADRRGLWRNERLSGTVGAVLSHAWRRKAWERSRRAVQRAVRARPQHAVRAGGGQRYNPRLPPIGARQLAGVAQLVAQLIRNQ